MRSTDLRLWCFILVKTTQSRNSSPTSTVSESLAQVFLALTNQEDDEVLFAIAEELGKIWELHTDKTVYLPLLEKLAKSDETVVRE